MHGKKRIDTGISQVDNEANLSTEERLEAHKRKQKSRGRPHSASKHRQDPENADVSNCSKDV